MNASRTLATTALIVLLALAPAALADDGSAGPTLSASTSRPAAAASPRDQAMALYHSVDELLAHREFDAARADVVTFREDHPDAAAWTRSLDRELEVLGKPAPKDWSIETWFQGQSDVVLDGSRPTVVLFWEAWCPHCRHEAPRLEALYERYRERGLQVIGVTRLTHDATEQSVREFLDDPPAWSVAHGGSAGTAHG